MIQQKNIELLAPAKNKETAFEAINCGADAVYIGAPAFGARQNASNSLDDIKEVVNYAHKFWSKVHITINTILTNSELDEAVKLVHQLEDIGVDAIIVQDTGLLNRLIKDNCSLPVHMSTQCDNYLPEKIKFWNKIGVSRVILARELSIDQINQIHNENPDLELEAFIHGALCVSMSGQCYLSQYIGGRSANRGECAQPCRKKYDVIDNNGNIIADNIYPLCLKDFNGSKYIKELINAGVCSFKIEGRLKDAGYVKNIVAYYRSLLGNGSSSGRSIYQFQPNPEKSFNRGFTNYFLNSREDCYCFDSPKSKGEYIGKVLKIVNKGFIVETEKKIHPQDGLYFNNDGCLVNKVYEDSKDDFVTIYPNKNIEIKVGDIIYRNLDVDFEKAIQRPVKRQIGVNIEVTNRIHATDEDGVSIMLDIPYSESAKNPEKMKETFIKQFSKTGEGDFYIINIKISQNTDIPFMPVSKINELRRTIFKILMDKRLKVYEENRVYQKKMKYTKYFVSEVDYRANVHNESAKEFYKKCGSNVTEMSLETKIPNRQVELMRCKHCIKYALNMCKSPIQLYLRDSHNTIYPLKFNCKNCEMSVLSPVNNQF